MNHADHVELLRGAVEPGGTWADIGAGSGAFTLALADLLGPGGRIVAVDRDARALEENADAVGARFPTALWRRVSPTSRVRCRCRPSMVSSRQTAFTS